MRENRTSGSMSGKVETGHGRRLLRHNRGNPDTEVSRSLNYRATSRLYLRLLIVVMLQHNVCREKSAMFSGCNSHLVTGRSNR